MSNRFPDCHPQRGCGTPIHIRVEGPCVSWPLVDAVHRKQQTISLLRLPSTC